MSDLTWHFGTTEPNAWYSRALQLWSAAELIFSESAKEEGEINTGKKNLLDSKFHELEATATMLMGFAVENALKGHALEIGNVDFSQNLQRLDLPVDGHALIEWANLAQFPPDSKGAELLEKLEAFTRWAGRYPVPKHKRLVVPNVGSAALTEEERVIIKKWLNRLTGFAWFSDPSQQ